MIDDPADDRPEGMPTEHDFTRAGRNPYAARLAGATSITIDLPDGSVRQVPLASRTEVGPESLTGIVGETLFYTYNPLTDVLLVRLVASLTDPVSDGDAEPGFQVLTSDDTGKVVGMVVFGFLRRFDFLAPLAPPQRGEAVNPQLVECALEPLRELLPAS